MTQRSTPQAGDGETSRSRLDHRKGSDRTEREVSSRSESGGGFGDAGEAFYDATSFSS